MSQGEQCHRSSTTLSSAKYAFVCSILYQLKERTTLLQSGKNTKYFWIGNSKTNLETSTKFKLKEGKK